LCFGRLNLFRISDFELRILISNVTQWPIEARRCFNKSLDRRSKSGLYFLSWFVSKEEFFTNP